MATQAEDQTGTALPRFDTPSVAPDVPPAPEWGSDVVVEMLSRLGVQYAALNPGASFRGIHDSLVNYGANQRPGMVLCNHEEVAIAIAHGYAKQSGRPMAAIVHSNVGLLHATMGLFNAWADRVPIYVLGATGPMDSTRRRPWIDWIHTANGQGQVVRDYTKWEHQPASIAAIPEAMLRAWQTMLVEPCGPVYVCMDAGLQEEHLEAALRLPDPARYPLPGPLDPPEAAVEEAARWLARAEFPVILLGQAGQTEADWRNLVELAELLGAAVLLDAKSPASFPTNHPLAQNAFSSRLTEQDNEIIGRADVILALDRIDTAGSLRPAGGPERESRGVQDVGYRLINVSLEPYAVRSWSTDFYELPPADLPITANAARTVALLLEAVRRAVRDDASSRGRAEARLAAHRERRDRLEAAWEARRREVWESSPIHISRLVGELSDALGDRQPEAILARIPLSWPAGIWQVTRPNAYPGMDGGAGLGSGPGMITGIALAALESGRPVVGVTGDGDMLMAPTALWTAAHHRIPALFVVANNQTYMNDEEHQARVARARSRPVENRWVGQRMDEPAVDFAGLARAQGVEGFGPVAEASDLAETYRRALAVIDSGRPALVDVRIGRA